MNKISLYRILGTLCFSLFLFSSCDQDFNEMGSGIVDDNHFAFLPDTTSTISAYSQSSGVVQSNNLPINSLGIYKDPVFGKVKSNFVTQLELETVNPVFLTANNPVLDSVVLTIPYFSTKKTDSNNISTYTLDSIKGTSAINLKVYESGYVLNSLDPTDNFQSQQNYYTDQTVDFDSKKKGLPLLLAVSSNAISSNRGLSKSRAKSAITKSIAGLRKLWYTVFILDLKQT